MLYKKTKKKLKKLQILSRKYYVIDVRLLALLVGT